MSSKYKVLCLSHDPATVAADGDWYQPEQAEEAIAAGIEGHEECDLLIGRYSYALVEVGCPTSKDRHGACGFRHAGTQWMDVSWLRLLAMAQQEPAGSGLHGAAEVAGRRCWSAERLHRLRPHLGLAAIAESKSAMPEPVTPLTRAAVRNVVSYVGSLVGWIDEVHSDVVDQITDAALAKIGGAGPLDYAASNSAALPPGATRIEAYAYGDSEGCLWRLAAIAADGTLLYQQDGSVPPGWSTLDWVAENFGPLIPASHLDRPGPIVHVDDCLGGPACGCAGAPGVEPTATTQPERGCRLHLWDGSECLPGTLLSARPDGALIKVDPGRPYGGTRSWAGSRDESRTEVPSWHYPCTVTPTFGDRVRVSFVTTFDKRDSTGRYMLIEPAGTVLTGGATVEVIGRAGGAA